MLNFQNCTTQSVKSSSMKSQKVTSSDINFILDDALEIEKQALEKYLKINKKELISTTSENKKLKRQIGKSFALMLLSSFNLYLNRENAI